MTNATISYLEDYLNTSEKRDSAVIGFFASLDQVSKVSPKIATAILQELKDQKKHLKLIASENFCSLPTQLAMGNLLTDKYSEGYPHHRFYAGCENVDVIEEEAVNELKNLFHADHAYVQPHSGADANLIAFWSVLVKEVQMPFLDGRKLESLSDEEKENLRLKMNSQKIMGLSLNSGGHLTHGYCHNVSSKMFQAVSYDIDPETESIDYDALQKMAEKEKPLILIAGYSAYPKKINFKKMKQIAESVNATLLVDMAHFAGLVAGKVFTGEFDPVPYADIVTSTTHKTLRGPRGGLILCKESYKDFVNKGCPLVIGGPLPHVIAAKAIAFKEANTEEFQTYSQQIVDNAKALAKALIENGVSLFGNGTENHLLVADVSKSFGITGRAAELALRKAFITVNRNTVPFDTNGAWYTSGIRIGTPALTTLGMKEGEMKEIASMIVDLLKNTKQEGSSKAKTIIDPAVLKDVQEKVGVLMKKFPLYPELNID